MSARARVAHKVRPKTRPIAGVAMNLPNNPARLKSNTAMLIWIKPRVLFCIVDRQPHPERCHIRGKKSIDTMILGL